MSQVKNGKARLLQVKETHRGINIMSRVTGRTSGVKRKSVEEGHRKLGFHMSGDGKCEAHKKVMIDKAILHSNAIRNSTMWRGETGECNGIQLLLYTKLGIWGASDNTDKGGM
jgi:hypothetical protein